MTVRKNRIRLVGALLAVVLSLSLGGCAVREGSADDGRLRVVTTLFPYYDFARAIAGGRADVTLLLAPGREAHSFEPTPLDAVTISRADVFIYNGGEGEVWADDMLDAVGEDIGTVLRMMDFVDAREEEFSEGMQGADSHDHAHEHDHDHDHGDHCSCGCGHDHDHDHAGHHHADEVFTSWGVETPKKFSEEEIREKLSELDDCRHYGTILRAKGFVDSPDGEWVYFDYVPGAPEIRRGSADYTGRLCVIGSQLKEHEIAELFHV